MESLDPGAAPGEPEAGVGYEALWREWRPRAAAYARAFGGLSAEDREELADEAVARAWEARARFRAGSPFAPWFFQIVRRLALDALRRRREEPKPPAFFEGQGSSPPEAEEAALRDAEAEFVRRFVAGLPVRDRELSSLVYGQGLGLAEAACVLGVPAGTAKWRLSEIRKALRRAWEREYGE